MVTRLRNLARFHGFVSKQYTTDSSKWPRQVLSAIQPTGKIHLGNYLGAVKKWIDLQNSEENQVIFGIADLHSLTMPHDPQELQRNILMTTATLLACGIDLKKSILFQQSMVTLHAQLCWILATMTTMPRLSQLPQFEEKSKQFKVIPVGIFLYPVLQAADIMLYRATHVPVGEDQIQHLVYVNHLIKKFNNQFGATFPEITPLIDSASGRIKNLIDPSKKMSKSDSSSKSTITLMDTPDEILYKCKKAMTDFKSEVTFEGDARPGVSNLIRIHCGLSGRNPEDIVQEAAGMDTGQYKIYLAEYIIEYFKPIRQRANDYLNSPDYLIKELEFGSSKAKAIAEKTMNNVSCKIGLDLKMFNNEQPVKCETAL
ncbi:hypothetical protein RUM44_011175 [Polyplax serrata]|uniref:tryptophan--tRNA ligase n=1 Tax=Polyplax serrata TaxID=468196 RepID=A0ABR1APE9_POLSC